MDSKKEPLLPALLRAAKDSKDVVTQLAGIVLDAATGTDLFERIPVVGAVVATVGFCDAVMAMKLKRNVAAFLEACGSATPEQLDRLYDEVMGDPRFRDDVPDTVAQVLLESSKPIKPQIVGRLFAALAQRHISLEDFETLALIVLGGSVPALQAVPGFFAKNDGRPYQRGVGEVFAEGLLLSLGVAFRFGNMFRLDERGKQLYRLGFGGVINETTA